MSEDNKFPYKFLGKRLKSVREKSRQSLMEVSGAVEIDTDKLSSIEMGIERPSEDILLLLISHFAIKEEEANSLWELAAYEKHHSHNDDNIPSVVVMQNDARIVYTDLLHVTANKYGIVINFMQESGPAGQPLIVSRLGMSKDHAHSVVEVLNKILEVSDPKALPAPEIKNHSRTKRKSDKK